MAETALERIPDHTRLSRGDQALILKLREDGRTQVEIAQLVGCHQSSVSRLLQDFSDTRLLARETLRRDAHRFAERVVESADVDQSLEVLDRLEVLPKRQSDSKGGVSVLIGINASPIGPDPIALSPSVTDVIHSVTVDKAAGDAA